jgi:hypothetical protein
MATLYLWEKIVLGTTALLSFIAGLQTGGIIDGIMAVAINTVIVFALFKLGNKIFKKKIKN